VNFEEMKKKIVKFFKRYWIIVVFSLSLPFITQLLAWWNLNVAIGGGTTWIGFFGSYFGSIIGGVIAGLVTFQGIKYTIDNEQRKESEKSIPQNILVIEDTLLLLRDLKNKFENQDDYDSEVRRTKYRTEVSLMLGSIGRKELLLKTASVDLETYRALRDLYDDLDSYLYVKNAAIKLDEDYVMDKLKSTIDDFEDLQVKILLRYHKAINSHP